MKSIYSFILMLVAIIVAAFTVVPSASAADIDFRQSVTSVAGTVTHTFTNTDNIAFSAFELDDVIVGTAANATNTIAVAYIVGTGANAITNTATSVAGNTNRKIAVTNAPVFLVGDRVVLTLQDTNTTVHRLIGRKR
jgi:hypothetical protein